MQLQYVWAELDHKTNVSLNQVINNYSNAVKNRYAQFGSLASFRKTYNSKCSFVASS